MAVIPQVPRFIEPLAMPKLHRELSSAACYAELARLAKSWEANNIERAIYGRDLDKHDHERLRGTFFNLRDGGSLREKNVDEIQSRRPFSRLRLCWEHPIGEILTDPGIGQDRVLDILKKIPSTPVRRCIFSYGVTIMTWSPVVIDLRDREDRIARLENMATPYSLLALIGRMRLAQMRGEDWFEHQYEQAIFRSLPHCIAGSPHLYLGQAALLEAFDLFRRWKPASENRVFQWNESDVGFPYMHDQLDTLMAKVEKPEEFYPPDSQLRRRAENVQKILEGAELPLV